MSDQYSAYPDSGSLFSTVSKRTTNSPDYFGSIAIDLRNMTKIEVVDGLTIIKLSGWKKVSKSGKTYLSVSVDRFVPRGEESQAAPAASTPDEF
jgi:uncharacterized protein (DUF736 family)